METTKDYLFGDFDLHWNGIAIIFCLVPESALSPLSAGETSVSLGVEVDCGNEFEKSRSSNTNADRLTGLQRGDYLQLHERQKNQNYEVYGMTRIAIVYIVYLGELLKPHRILVFSKNGLLGLSKGITYGRGC